MMGTANSFRRTFFVALSYQKYGHVTHMYESEHGNHTNLHVWTSRNMNLELCKINDDSMQYKAHWNPCPPDLKKDENVVFPLEIDYPFFYGEKMILSPSSSSSSPLAKNHSRRSLSSSSFLPSFYRSEFVSLHLDRNQSSSSSYYPQYFYHNLSATRFRSPSLKGGQLWLDYHVMVQINDRDAQKPFLTLYNLLTSNYHVLELDSADWGGDMLSAISRLHGNGFLLANLRGKFMVVDYHERRFQLEVRRIVEESAFFSLDAPVTRVQIQSLKHRSLIHVYAFSEKKNGFEILALQERGQSISKLLFRQGITNPLFPAPFLKIVYDFPYYFCLCENGVLFKLHEKSRGEDVESFSSIDHVGVIQHVHLLSSGLLCIILRPPLSKTSYLQLLSTMIPRSPPSNN